MRITTYSLKLNVVEDAQRKNKSVIVVSYQKYTYMKCWMRITTIHFQKNLIFMESLDCCIVFCVSFYCDQICMRSIILFVSLKIWKRYMHLWYITNGALSSLITSIQLERKFRCISIWTANHDCRVTVGLFRFKNESTFTGFVRGGKHIEIVL